ncbi:MAG: response regulator [Nitrospirae bacterium]|nr:response regulator [Nitrospirota bacterium]
MADVTKYCLCCGEKVPVNTITRDGKLEQTCVYCGFVLDVAMDEEKTMAECVLTADDAELTRDLLKGTLLKQQLARSVVTAVNGQECVASFTKRLTENLPVDLVILDLEMPVMDGITAARVMRAVEGKYRTSKVPILFFSARKCDEALKQQLSLFSPASYVNKGSDSDSAKLVERIDQLVGYLLSKREAAS